MGGSLSLIASLAVDPSGVGPGVAEAEAKIKTFAANSAAAMQSVNQASATVAEGLRAQGASVEQASEIYKQLGMNGAEAAREIGAAFEAAETQAVAAAESTRTHFVSTNLELRTAEQIMGVHMPRGISHLISAMPELQAAIGAAFQAGLVVFFVEEM